ncbi:hypothetical protein DPMN_178991 [Dreissena polymorpha]|uniref:Uncharacterized protein n=1 Tax=Dreissena polymorpha TaxID=45954 RepID=A0A9D4ILQ4_DREPO|nr:hypothetical protein DPMN_178991 [Dreissena polymorpha]
MNFYFLQHHVNDSSYNWSYKITGTIRLTTDLKCVFVLLTLKHKSIVKDCSYRLAEKIVNADNGLAAKIRLVPENKIGMKFNDNH